MQFRCLYFDERRISEFCEAASYLSFAHASGTYHQNILGGDFSAQFRVNLQASPAIAQRNGHCALGFGLPNNVFIELVNNFTRRHSRHGLTQCFDSVVVVGVDTNVARDLQAFGDNFRRGQVALVQQCTSGRAYGPYAIAIKLFGPMTSPLP